MLIGAKITALTKLKTKKSKLEEQLKAIKAEIAELDAGIIIDLDASELVKSTGGTATVSIREAIKPKVDDWDLFYGFIYKKKYGHLLDRRPNVMGCRELFESKGKIPGVSPIVVRTLAYSRSKK